MGIAAMSLVMLVFPLASPSFVFYFLNKSPPFTVCYPARALPISWNFRHLLPVCAVLTYSPWFRHLFATSSGRGFRISKFLAFFLNCRGTVSSLELPKFSLRIVLFAVLSSLSIPFENNKTRRVDNIIYKSNSLFLDMTVVLDKMRTSSHKRN